MLRLFLPPNLASAAPRDAIAVKVELDLAQAPAAELFPALALLQRWAGTATPPKFLQLKRAQLRDLIAALQNQQVFFWLNGPTVPIAWQEDGLAGVSVFLKQPALPARTGAASSSGAARIGSADTRAPSVARNATARMTVDGSEHFLAITLPSRESLSYTSALELLKSSGFTLDPSSRKWWLRDRHKTLNFLATHGARLRNALDAEFTPNFEKNTAHLREAEVVCDAIEAHHAIVRAEPEVAVVRLRDGDDGALRQAVRRAPDIHDERRARRRHAQSKRQPEDEAGEKKL